MPTLYVENVPADVYAALRARARARGTSMASETIALLREHIPTAATIRRRRAMYQAFLQLQRSAPPAEAPVPSTAELVRESREELEKRGW